MRLIYTTWIEQIKRSAQWIYQGWRENFWARWLILHTIGWVISIYLGALCVSWLGGPMSILLAGGLTSGLMSLIQLHAMETPFSARLWVLASVAGGATAGGCILFLMSAILIVMIFSWTRFGLAIPFLIIGSLYGLSVGSAQGLIIGQKRHIWGYYWAIGWCFSGGICALTSLPAMSVWLCWPGPILFSLVMGTVWFHLKRALNNLT